MRGETRLGEVWAEKVLVKLAIDRVQLHPVFQPGCSIIGGVPFPGQPSRDISGKPKFGKKMVPMQKTDGRYLGEEKERIRCVR